MTHVKLKFLMKEGETACLVTQ